MTPLLQRERFWPRQQSCANFQRHEISDGIPPNILQKSFAELHEARTASCWITHFIFAAAEVQLRSSGYRSCLKRICVASRVTHNSSCCLLMGWLRSSMSHWSASWQPMMDKTHPASDLRTANSMATPVLPVNGVLMFRTSGLH